jgi:amidophosphoribosyltransferase
VRKGNNRVTAFDSSCFDGVYVTQDVDDAYFERLSNQRNDVTKQKQKKKKNKNKNKKKNNKVAAQL